MTFDAAQHLQRHGWQGHGSALQKGGRARPITAISKKTPGGVGHGSFDATPWWDDLYKAAAKSKKGKQKLVEGEHDLATKGSLGDAVAAAKLQGARRTLYATFLRGEVLAGSESEATDKKEEPPARKEKKRKGDEDAAARAEKRRKRRAARQQV